MPKRHPLNPLHCTNSAVVALCSEAYRDLPPRDTLFGLICLPLLDLAPIYSSHLISLWAESGCYAGTGMALGYHLLRDLSQLAAVLSFPLLKLGTDGPRLRDSH